jgi:hypothetical protein
MKAYGGSGGIVPLFLTTALDVNEWSASRPGRFTHGENVPVPQSRAGRCVKEKSILPLPGNVAR